MNFKQLNEKLEKLLKINELSLETRQSYYDKRMAQIDDMRFKLKDDMEKSYKRDDERYLEKAKGILRMAEPILSRTCKKVVEDLDHVYYHKFEYNPYSKILGIIDTYRDFDYGVILHSSPHFHKHKEIHTQEDFKVRIDLHIWKHGDHPFKEFTEHFLFKPSLGQECPFDVSEKDLEEIITNYIRQYEPYMKQVIDKVYVLEDALAGKSYPDVDLGFYNYYKGVSGVDGIEASFYIIYKDMTVSMSSVTYDAINPEVEITVWPMYHPQGIKFKSVESFIKNWYNKVKMYYNTKFIKDPEAQEESAKRIQKFKKSN